jgi:hypothetical protein
VGTAFPGVGNLGGTIIGGVLGAGAAIATGILVNEIVDLAEDFVRREGDPQGSAGGPGAGRPFSEGTRDAVRDASGNTCAYCSQETTRDPEPTPSRSHVDHVTPKAQGGNNTPENAVNTCQTCNLNKGNRTPQQWEPRWFDPPKAGAGT